MYFVVGVTYMKLIPIRTLKVGETLSTAIRMQDGRILLPAKALITENYLKRLGDFGIHSVYVEDSNFDDIIVTPTIDADTKALALNTVATVYASIKKGVAFKEDAVKTAGAKISDAVRQTLGSPISLFDTFAIEDERCNHAVNVATIAAAMAAEYGFNAEKMQDCVIGALLHDIMVDNMNNDDDFAHTQKAYEYLKLSRGVSARSYIGVLMHHENMDGTGGPKKLQGEAISEYAKIIAVADNYDKLVNGYGCKKMFPHQAVEYLQAMANKQLDPEFLKIFVNSVAIYPTGATVNLNNGYKAVVVNQNFKVPTRPKVRLCMKKREECVEFNLLTERTLFIESVEL